MSQHDGEVKLCSGQEGEVLGETRFVLCQLEKIPDCTKSKILSAYDLVVMQNVTNELGEKVTDGLLENMKFLLERTKKKNGYLIMTTRGLQNRGLTKSLRILEKKDVSLNLILDRKIQLESVIKQNKILKKHIYNDTYPRRDNAFQTIVVEGNKNILIKHRTK